MELKFTKRFAFIVYKNSCNNGEYSEDIYKSGKYDTEEDTELFIELDSYDGLVRAWEDNLHRYEGMTYCIWDSELEDFIVAGAYDPNDLDYLDDYDPVELRFL